MTPATPGQDSTLAERMLFAIRAEGYADKKKDSTGKTAVETALMSAYPERFKSRGFMSRYTTGARAGKSGKSRRSNPDPDVIKIIADFLRVNFEWLLIGQGSMRREAVAGGTTTLEKEAAYAALAFVDLMDQRGFAYGRDLGERYRAMRSAVRAVQEKRQLEIAEVTSVTIAIDKIRRASTAFMNATESTSRAARSADKAVLHLIRRAG